jgi:hypothetical protein
LKVLFFLTASYDTIEIYMVAKLVDLKFISLFLIPSRRRWIFVFHGPVCFLFRSDGAMAEVNYGTSTTEAIAIATTALPILAQPKTYH